MTDAPPRASRYWKQRSQPAIYSPAGCFLLPSR
jgi:hypothetical protein